MSISKKRSKRAKNDSPQEEKYPPRYVVPESVMNDFVGNLGVHDINTAAARLQIVADATRQVDRIEESDLQLIKSLTVESNDRRYRQIMKAIVSAIAQGPRGINAAHLTACHIVKLAFMWTLEYLAALELYKERLRKIRPESSVKVPVTKPSDECPYEMRKVEPSSQKRLIKCEFLAATGSG